MHLHCLPAASVHMLTDYVSCDTKMPGLTGILYHNYYTYIGSFLNEHCLGVALGWLSS